MKRSNDIDGARPESPTRELPMTRRRFNPFSAGSPGSAPVLAATVFLLSFAGALLLLQQLVIAPQSAALADERLTARATVLATSLQARVDLVHQVAADAARSPAVVSALAADTPLARESLERQLSATLPHSLRVRINPVGAARAATDESPPLSFAGLDMIRRAERQESIRPESLRIDGQTLFNMARPVVDPDSGDVLGSFFVTFAPAVVGDVLRELDATGQSIVLQQRIAGSDPVQILGLGTRDPGQAHIAQPLDRSDWTLDYAIDRSLLAGAGVTWTALLPSLVLLLLGGLGGLIVSYRRLAGHLEADLGTLVASACGLLEGRDGYSRNHYTLEPVAAASDAIRHAQSHRDQNPVEPARAAPLHDTPAETARPAPPVKAQADEDFLEITDTATERPMHPEQSITTTPSGIPGADIFRAYDIRGVVGDTLTEEGAFLIGRAIGSAAAEAGETLVAVGADGRHSSPALSGRICAGIQASGVDVLDIGEVPTPILYFATHVTETRSGVMITGSHNPPDYNGFKIVIDGVTLAGDAITALHRRIIEGDLASGEGQRTEHDLIDAYIDRIAADVVLAQPLKVVADCGNGVAGKVIPHLLEALGCEVLPLYCDVDGSFPNHHPDPADPANLEDLITTVKAQQADIGLAFDGDGDRLGVVTGNGEIIWPDRLLMLFARDIVGRNPGADVIFDVKCSRHLNTLISEYGGRPIMWRTGHSHIKAKMKETRALLGGEFSGHICFGERWFGFDDGLYSAARLLELLAAEDMSAAEVFAEFPNPLCTPEQKIATTDQAKFTVMDALAKTEAFAGGTLTTIDGIRVDYPEGWGLIRASNTSPVLTLRFEADDARSLIEIRERFRAAIAAVDPALEFPA